MQNVSGLTLLLAVGSHPGWRVFFALAALGWTTVAYLFVAQYWAKTVPPRHQSLSTRNRRQGDLWGRQATTDLWRGRTNRLTRIGIMALVWAATFTIVAVITAP
jgi:hypothetical protein